MILQSPITCAFRDSIVMKKLACTITETDIMIQRVGDIARLTRLDCLVDCIKALISMYKNNFKDGYSFQEYLESNKIDIESRGLEKNGDHSFTIIFLPSRKNIKNLSLLEYMWQATPNNQITVIYDKNGVVKKIGKYKFKD